jgi:predicted RNase H-like nuclease (RuvC/YqgF family)
MGSDYALNPPPPPPIWEQVKALHDRNEEQRAIICVLKAERDRLRRDLEQADRANAEMLRREQA